MINQRYVMIAVCVVLGALQAWDSHALSAEPFIQVMIAIAILLAPIALAVSADTQVHLGAVVAAAGLLALARLLSAVHLPELVLAAFFPGMLLLVNHVRRPISGGARARERSDGGEGLARAQRWAQVVDAGTLAIGSARASPWKSDDRSSPLGSGRLHAAAGTADTVSGGPTASGGSRLRNIELRLPDPVEVHEVGADVDPRDGRQKGVGRTPQLGMMVFRFGAGITAEAAGKPAIGAAVGMHHQDDPPGAV